MLKSKLFIKSIIMVVSLIIFYNLAVLLFTLPKIDNSIRVLEEKDAKDILNSIVVLTTNVQKDLQTYKNLALKNHKKELKNLTDTAWSIIAAKYNQSKPQNIGSSLEKRAKEFELNLMNFYNKNKDLMSKEKLKTVIKNYINIYRYENGVGYFWINDFTPKMIMHPIVPSLNGKYLGDYKDPNGVYLFNDMVDLCKKNGKGIVNYKWLNPKSKKVEDKISYVFTFKPFNWIIGTGEYISVLQKRLQNDVINIVRELRYGDGNYFFIYDYNNIAISHPYIQGKDMSNFKDKKGKLVLPELIKLARKKGDGFLTYWWPKKATSGKISEKLTYVKDFPNWKMVIATGIFIDDIQKEVDNRKKKLMYDLRQIVNKTKIGKTGYLFIFDKDANMLIHPNENIDGTNFAKVRNPVSKSYLFNDLVNSSKKTNNILYYKWDRLDDKGNYIYDKIAWTKYIPSLGWYISSTVYADEFKESSRDIRDFIFKLFIVVFLVTILYSVLFFRKMLIPISELSNLSLKVIQGNYSVRSSIDQDNEIGVLSNSFNKMLDTTEDLINNLDQKIHLRTLNLELAKKEIETIHKHTKDSIEYASLIQSALIPEENSFKNYFKDFFVIWQPKDTVGGDIYLFEELRDESECLLMFIDCTGHGVPGAFVTMLIKAIEREVISEIVNNKELDVNPSAIMSYFNVTLKKLLKQDGMQSISNAGFDGGIIYYNQNSRVLKFCGAQTSLFYTDNSGELHTIKGDRSSVGYKKCDLSYQYKQTTIKVEEGFSFYCTTDGYLDQNGGEKDFPFGKKRFINLIKENFTLPMKEQKDIFLNTIEKYQNMIENNDRNDDITVIGFTIDKKPFQDLVLLEFEGILTQGILAHSMDVIEHGIDERGMIGKVSTLTIEFTQNMINYSKSYIENSKDTRATGYIKVSVDKNHIYLVQSKNIVTKEDKYKIEQKLNYIKTISNKEIDENYKDLRRDIEDRFKQNEHLGLGFYEISKLSHKLEYDFISIENDEKYYFILKAYVKSKR